LQDRRRSWEILLKVEGWTSEYASVDKLLRHLKRKTGSEGSRATYLKTLAQFVKFAGLSPDELASLKKEQVEEKVQAFCDLAKAPRTANRKMEELKTFFMCNGFRTGNKCNLVLERRYVGARERARFEYIPTEEEISRILNESGLNLKWRAFFLTMYTTGLRNSTVRAIRYGDIREELEQNKIPLLVRVYPEMKKIVPEACKNKIPYFVFMPKETIEAVKAYLEEREAKLGPLDSEQILFCTDNRQIPKEKRPYTPLNMTAPQKMLKKAAKLAKIREWKYVTPHCLRKAYERAVRNSGLSIKDQEFFMGHILPGTQDTYYDKTKIEEFRVKYARIQFFRKAEVDKIEMLKTFAKTLGIEEIEIKIQKIRQKNPELNEMEILGKIIREELGLRPFRTKLVKYREKSIDCVNDDCQKYESKIVHEEELLPYLNEGWDIVKELKGRKVIIRRKLPTIEE